MGREERERKKQEQLEKQKARQIKQVEQVKLERQIKQEVIPDPLREIKSIEFPDPDRTKLQWCFEVFDHVTDWRENGRGDHVGFCSVAEHMKSYSTMTWNEIKANKHRDHPIPIGNLCDRARKRLTEIQQDDADELWRLRFTNTQRLWGIRMGHILRLVWWDPDHQVCPTEPKNT